ncbi:MAG: AAA family ATPase [Pseudomonadota bacterium]|nr:AAA family ATPase [Pseudomonadota bacterium]
MSAGIDSWLAEHGLESLSATMRTNDIDLDVLKSLTASELTELGISLGNRKRLLKALAVPPAGPEPEAGGGSRAAPLSERRQVTILFADMVGFTSIANRLDPEETHRLLTRYFEVVDRVITDFGGTIDKHIGDAVMAVFGAPKSYGNDAERAARASQAIHLAISALEPPLEVHIGVAGGEVLASRTGSHSHAEYTVTGSSVNLASRLQGQAGGGETLISDTVFRAIADFSECEGRGEITVKGVPARVKVWRLKNIAHRRDTWGTRIFVGRRSELQHAFAIIDGVRAQGHGGVLHVRGEAGIGKTHFVDQLEKRAELSGLSRHTGLVLDFGVGQGEDAVTRVMRSLLSLPLRAPELDLSTVVAGLVDHAVIGPADRVHAFAVLGISHTADLRSIFDAMDNEARKSGRLRAIAAIVRHVAGTSPLFIRIEDVHWADEAALEAFAALAGETVERPIVVVMTSRFEGDRINHAWRAAARGCGLVTLELGPLRDADARALAGNYIGATDDFARRCIARAAGNPLFLEQLLRSGESSAVPGSVQSIVQARLDQLEPADAEALRAAAVLGQRFSLAPVRSMIGNDGYSCSQLISHQLVRTEGDDYLFTHALLRDGTYQSMISDRRMRLHGRAAAWFAGRDPILYARHLDIAGDRAASSAYLAAAEAQSAAHLHESAAELCRSGLKLDPERSVCFALLTLLGNIQLATNEAAAAIETFEKALAIAATPDAKAEALRGIAGGMRIVDRQSDAEERITAALDLAARSQNHLLLAQCLFLKGNLAFPMAQYGACIESHAAALDHARRAGSAELEVQALGGLGDAYYLCGRMKTARGYFSECVERARASRLTRISAANLPMLSECDLYYGELDLSLAHALEAIEEARSISHARAELIALTVVAARREERREIGLHKDAARAMIKISQQLGSHRFEAHGWGLLGRAHLFDCEIAASREYFHKALELAKDSLSFSGPSIMGGLVLAAGSASERNDWIAKALEVLRSGAVSFNHLGFYADAIEACLIDKDLQGARRYCGLLEEYTALEPLPWSDFIISKARWAADLAENAADESLRAKGTDLLKRGRAMGLNRSLAVFAEVAG